MRRECDVCESACEQVVRRVSYVVERDESSMEVGLVKGNLINHCGEAVLSRFDIRFYATQIAMYAIDVGWMACKVFLCMMCVVVWRKGQQHSVVYR